MIGIYQDDFIDYLTSIFSIPPKITAKNIICPCPWCEYNRKKNHYHLYISLTDPIFHCFASECGQKGFLTKFLNKLEGVNTRKFSKFVDVNKIKKTNFNDKSIKNKKQTDLKFPKINLDEFPYKTLYLKKRFKFHSHINIENLNGLIFDFLSFLRINNITFPENDKMNKIKNYLHDNFVGFATTNNKYIIFRKNIINTFSNNYILTIFNIINFIII